MESHHEWEVTIWVGMEEDMYLILNELIRFESHIKYPQKAAWSKNHMGYICMQEVICLIWNKPLRFEPQFIAADVHRMLARVSRCTVVSQRSAHPPPFGPISCTGFKFTWMSAHPGVSFTWSLRSKASNTMWAEVRNSVYRSVPQIRSPVCNLNLSTNRRGGGLIRGMGHFLSRLRPPFWCPAHNFV